MRTKGITFLLVFIITSPSYYANNLSIIEQQTS